MQPSDNHLETKGWSVGHSPALGTPAYQASGDANPIRRNYGDAKGNGQKSEMAVAAGPGGLTRAERWGSYPPPLPRGGGVGRFVGRILGESQDLVRDVHPPFQVCTKMISRISFFPSHPTPPFRCQASVKICGGVGLSGPPSTNLTSDVVRACLIPSLPPPWNVGWGNGSEQFPMWSNRQVNSSTPISL